MKHKGVEEVARQIDNIFSPLAAKLHLNGPHSVQHGTVELNLWYVGEPLGVKLDVELIGFMIDPMLFRSFTNELPCDYVHCQKIHISRAFEMLGIEEDEQFNSLRQSNIKYDSKNCDKTMKIIIALLETHWHILVENVDKLFD